MMRTRLISQESEFHALEREWERLWQLGPRPEVFGCFAWARQFLRAYGAGRGLCCLVAEEADGTVRGILPLWRDERGRLRFVGDPRSDYSDVLCAPEDAPEVVPLLLGGVARRCELSLHAVPEHALLLQAAAVAGRRGYRLEVEEPCPAIVFDEAGEVATGLLRKESLRRHEKKVAKLGPVALRRLTTQSEALQALPALFDQHVRRWRAAGTPSLFEEAASQEFYRGLIQDDALWPLVDFRLLHAGERLVATHFGFFHDRRFLWYKPSFDPDLASLGAGEVLLKHLIAAVTAEGAREFDFTRGNEGFKQRFANVTRVNYRVDCPNFWRKLRSAAARARDWARTASFAPSPKRGASAATRAAGVPGQTFALAERPGHV